MGREAADIRADNREKNFRTPIGTIRRDLGAAWNRGGQVAGGFRAAADNFYIDRS